MNRLELQKQFLNVTLQALGKEALSPEETEKLITDLNRKMILAEVAVYALGLAILGAGGALAGSLLGFPGLASGAAVIVLRIVTTFNAKVEAHDLRHLLIKKMLTTACDTARVARKSTASVADLTGKKN